jgi:hypothetical protein
MVTSMGFPTWTLWGMGLSALGALAAIALALLAQSPRMLTRLNLTGQRLDLRARAFTGYGLALLLLAMGFFAAGVPLSPEDRVTVAETGDNPSISLLAPEPGHQFTTADTINFDWFWPTLPQAGQQFVVYLSDGAQEYMLGFVGEPNNGAAYRLAVSGRELPVVGQDLTWWVRLEAADSGTVADSEEVADSRVIAASETMPLSVSMADDGPGPNGSQSGAMIGLATMTPDLTAGSALTDTLPLTPGAATGEPGATAIAEAGATEAPPPTATPTPPPTATPTPTPPPTPTPTPILGPTARVIETSDLPVRAKPDGAVLVVLVRGDIVIPLSGHAFHSGDVWREVSTVAGVIGWVQEQFLEYATAAE